MGWTQIVSVHVPGTPVQQGSLSPGGRGQLYYPNAAKLKPWRNLIAATVQEALPQDWLPTALPVQLGCVFTFPASDATKKRHAVVAGPFKPTEPDLDKLLRAVGDSLTGVVYRDDSQVTMLTGAKMFETEGSEAGLTLAIHVWRV